MNICRILKNTLPSVTGLPSLLLGGVLCAGFMLSPFASQPVFAQEEYLAPRPPVVPLGTPEAEPQAAVVNADSALPDGGMVEPRAPGMQLPIDSMVPDGAHMAGMPVEKSPEEIAREIREEAFNAALTGILPLEPEEIRKVLKRYDQTQKASEVPIYEYPEPQVVVRDVSLDPGVNPVEIKVATGHVSTLNVLDVSGAPWPIQDITWAGNFEIVQPESGGHVVRITPMSEFAYGNMSVRLLELKTPITFVLRAHRDEVYFRMDARLAEYGPLATPPIIDGGLKIAAGSPSMTAILDGSPPPYARKLDVAGVDGRTTAFNYEGMVYVRTPLTLLSPAWTGSIKSADGMNVYTLNNAPVLLLSDQGRMVRARLSERKSAQ